MDITIRICDPCYEIGEYKDAVATYVDAIGEEHDICKDCKKLVQEQGLLIKETLPAGEITIAEIRGEQNEEDS